MQASRQGRSNWAGLTPTHAVAANCPRSALARGSCGGGASTYRRNLTRHVTAIPGVDDPRSCPLSGGSGDRLLVAGQQFFDFTNQRTVVVGFADELSGGEQIAAATAAPE